MALPVVVCRRARVLFIGFVFVWVLWCPTHIVFCFILVFVFLFFCFCIVLCLPVSLNYTLLIAFGSLPFIGSVVLPVATLRSINANKHGIEIILYHIHIVQKCQFYRLISD